MDRLPSLIVFEFARHQVDADDKAQECQWTIDGMDGPVEGLWSAFQVDGKNCGH
jgi:hypothetical protein